MLCCIFQKNQVVICVFSFSEESGCDMSSLVFFQKNQVVICVILSFFRRIRL